MDSRLLWVGSLFYSDSAVTQHPASPPAPRMLGPGKLGGDEEVESGDAAWVGPFSVSREPKPKIRTKNRVLCTVGRCSHCEKQYIEDPQKFKK